MGPGSAIINRKEPRSSLGRVFNSKLGRIATLGSKCMVCMLPTSKVEISAKGSSCELKFVHDGSQEPLTAGGWRERGWGGE
jgi:hypothetical protein